MDQAGDNVRVDLILYQRLIRKLMYLKCRTRPDIAFVIGQLSQYNSDPRAGYFCIAKQVLYYNLPINYKVLVSRLIFTTHLLRTQIA